MKIHKADYKQKVLRYLGFGHSEYAPTSLCGGRKAYYAKKEYWITRNWKNVTCKHCLKRRKKK